MMRALVILALVLSLTTAALGFLAWNYRGKAAAALVAAHQATEALAQAEKSLKAERTVALKHSKELTALREKGKQDARNLDEALRKESVWADERVPGSVVDALGL